MNYAIAATDSPTNTVIVEERQTVTGHWLGLLMLNHPRKLNALNADMTETLLGQLLHWRDDPNISCVIITSTSDKAFCAGGDVVGASQYASSDSQLQESWQRTPATDFFAIEYHLNHVIRHYPKPLIVWGDGIVMGGGMGLFCHAGYRVVTEKSHLAMPEMTIGFCPDVGASWFLNRAPGKAGLFLGMTGVAINGLDALDLGLADFMVFAEHQLDFIHRLEDLHWHHSNDHNFALVAQLLEGWQAENPRRLPKRNVRPHLEWINQTCNGDDVDAIISRITRYQGPDEWLQTAAKQLMTGSPLTPHLVFEQLRRAATMNFASCLKMEFILACQSLRGGYFKEGVRARLIDKDRTPTWPATKITPELVQQYFTAPWKNGPHPLDERLSPPPSYSA